MLPITIVTEPMSARGSREALRDNPQARGPDMHRYFPEWADRQLRPGAYLEATRNSYLAGGYAEEFGYGVEGYGDEQGCRVGVCLIVDEPERCCLWKAQIGGLHPGYPEYATPHERDSRGPEHPGTDSGGAVEQARPQPSGGGAPADPGHVLVCRVREHVRPVSGILSVWRDLRIRRRGLNRFL